MNIFQTCKFTKNMRTNEMNRKFYSGPIDLLSLSGLYLYVTKLSGGSSQPTVILETRVEDLLIYYRDMSCIYPTITNFVDRTVGLPSGLLNFH